MPKPTTKILRPLAIAAVAVGVSVPVVGCGGSSSSAPASPKAAQLPDAAQQPNSQVPSGWTLQYKQNLPDQLGATNYAYCDKSGNLIYVTESGPMYDNAQGLTSAVVPNGCANGSAAPQDSSGLGN